MTSEPKSDPRPKRRWPPLVSVTALILLGAYVTQNGPESLSPTTSLGFVMAGGVVVAYAMRYVRRSVDNAVTAAIQGTALLLSGIAAVAFFLMRINAQGTEKVLQALLQSKTSQDVFISLGSMLHIAMLALSLLMIVFVLGVAVYGILFGPKHNEER